MRWIAVTLFLLFGLFSFCSWAEDSDSENCPYKESKVPPCDVSKNCITGNITVDSSMKYKKGDDDVLFVIVRKPGHDSVMPLAVLKISDPKFPQSFEVGPRDLIYEDSEFTGPFVIRAKLSRSGDATTQPGDLLGPEARKVKNGAKDLSLVLDEVAP